LAQRINIAGHSGIDIAMIVKANENESMATRIPNISIAYPYIGNLKFPTTTYGKISNY